MIPRLTPPVSLTNALTVLSTSSRQSEKSAIQLLGDYFPERDIYLTTSGRASLYLALKSLGLGEGDEIIVPSFTCPVVVDSIIHSGCEPVLADVSPDTFTITPDTLKFALTGRTKAVIFSYLFGIPANVQPILDICVDNDIFLIEDCAQALGVEVGGRYASLYGDISILSFNSDKYITSGGGGALLIKKDIDVADVERFFLNDDIDGEPHILGLILQTLFMKREVYRSFIPFTLGEEVVMREALSKDWIVKITENISFGDGSLDRIIELRDEVVGGEKTLGDIKERIYSIVRPLFSAKVPTIEPVGKLDGLRERLLTLELSRLNQLNDVRRKNTELLYNLLSEINGLSLFIEEYSTQPLLRFPLMIEDKAKRKIVEYRLNKAGYEVGLYNYPTPIHRIPVYRSLSRTYGYQRGSEQIVRTLLNLPIHTEMREGDFKRMAEMISEVIEPRG